jgi:UDP-N-acetylmuramoyl-L-alanyl-D-glutamate--2,6-diaminopimelate ligase
MVRLSEVVARLGGRSIATGSQDPELTDVHLDSRRVAPGHLFCALPGHRVDGLEFAASALERGAVALLAPTEAEARARALAGSVPLWLHDAARRTAGEAADLVHGSPSEKLTTFAVTGTNGKTTVAHILAHLLRAAGHVPAVVGTVGNSVAGGSVHEAHNTTPDATELQRLCAQHLAAGGDTLVTEASSHALCQHRLAGFDLDVAIFTNLTRDHLDYHGTMEEYAAAKALLFRSLKPGGHAILPADDPVAAGYADIARERGASVHTYSIGSRADLSASRLDVVPGGSTSFLDGMGISWESFVLPLVGVHNLANALAALAAVFVGGAIPPVWGGGLATVSPVIGRLDPAHVAGDAVRAYVDFAHTPDALRAALSALRAELEVAGRGRLVCLFGCGGEKDRGKRPLMARVASELADTVVLTSDNPRSEDPLAIIEQARVGLVPGANTIVEPDRRAAIFAAVAACEPGDVILLAGKGHELTQEIAGTFLPFSDALIVREALT